MPIAVVDHRRQRALEGGRASLKADPAFEVKRAATSRRRSTLAREGKVRAAIVLPAGFGAKRAGALMVGGGEKPVVAVHYDPSQATAMPMVRGLLTQHVMKALGDSLGGRRAGRRRPRAAAFSLPFDTQAVAVDRRADRPYNGYAHSFAGMGVQFILFMGIEVGVGVLLARRLGLWKRLRAAPLSRSAAARQPHRQRRDHRADPARDHLRRGDRASSTCASTAASPASSASRSPSRC